MTHPQEVLDALDVLRAHGWTVQDSVGWGHLTGTLLVHTYGLGGEPPAKEYRATSARQPWTEARP